MSLSRRIMPFNRLNIYRLSDVTKTYSLTANEDELTQEADLS